MQHLQSITGTSSVTFSPLLKLFLSTGRGGGRDGEGEGGTGGSMFLLDLLLFGLEDHYLSQGLSQAWPGC